MTGTRNLLVMAGGTGGHVYPALAVAQALRARGAQVSWLGTHRGLEARVIPANDIPIHWVTVEGLRGKGWSSWLLAPLRLIRALWQSIAAIRASKADCVLGMGGFVAGPGGVAAKLLGKPLIIHEQNAVAGLTNRYLAKLASEVLTGFEKVADLPARAHWVGNPVRTDITRVAPMQPGAPLKILVIGGSQGAFSFNQKLAAVFASLEQGDDVHYWHQAGRGNAAQVEDSYREAGVKARVDEFIEDMASAYAWADLLICRAGAMTIAECCAAGRPAVLVPYPFSAGDHQLRNAEYMLHAGAAKIIDNADLDSSDMQQALSALVSDPARLQAMGRAARALHKVDAIETVAAICEGYLNA